MCMGYNSFKGMGYKGKWKGRAKEMKTQSHGCRPMKKYLMVFLFKFGASTAAFAPFPRPQPRSLLLPRLTRLGALAKPRTWQSLTDSIQQSYDFPALHRRLTLPWPVVPSTMEYHLPHQGHEEHGLEVAAWTMWIGEEDWRILRIYVDGCCGAGSQM